FEQQLDRYAELIVKIGLNLQAGQRLLVGGPVFNSLAPLAAAPLVRLVAIHAYQAGARLVDVMWSDEQLQRIRFQHAPRDSFAEHARWTVEGALEYARRGDALLVISAQDPDLLKDQDQELVDEVQQTAFRLAAPMYDYVTRNAVNWLVASAAVPGWAAKLFPGLDPETQVARLWDVLFDICRVNRPDPVAAWQTHVRQLVARSDYLNHKQYTALKLTGPGTDLTVGLPHGHVWRSGRVTSQSGISFTPNLPTEEVFTLPHKEQTEGVVTTTKPLSYGGNVIERFSLTFAGGRVVKINAANGEALLRGLIGTDEGAGRLGEVALVPHSSPISQTGLLFYNILLDENAANHVALGRAYKFTFQGGEALSNDEFAAVGGNDSLVHVDFMIGSGEMDVDGLTADGTTEPLMRRGEWAFEL
ncbi:MAG: aminopeptidase, partial [Chloroflexi bacterium]|nr:aminopeptidase [Chloroflexota bacterium]